MFQIRGVDIMNDFYLFEIKGNIMELTGRNISFKYSSASRQILKDVDITIDNKKF